MNSLIEFLDTPRFLPVFLGLYLGVFYLLHSALAGKNLLGTKQQNSRKLFNLIALVGFVPPLVLIALYKTPLWDEQITALKIPAIVLIPVGGMILFRSFQSFDGSAFLGMSPEQNKSGLQTGGMYQYSRHPMYFGTLLLFIGAFLWRQDLLMLIFSVISIAYLFIGSKNEEKKLVRQFPEEYPRYRSSTPAIIPSNLPGFFKMALFQK
ncbi:MAG TPA: isoprenylcysteine carboxylmethyltransferase family protein [Saprospiraceae bacterium]|nr:isoprenylcysteine carboxylmethyltransferase family protein [Saprospiraceae bacterium]